MVPVRQNLHDSRGILPCLLLIILIWVASSFPSLAVPSKLGDLNDDGQVSVLDLTRLQMHLQGIAPLASELQLFADVNQDALVTDADIETIADIIMGLRVAQDLPPPGVLSFSPDRGEGNVSLTRETVVRFTQPLSGTNALGTNVMCATFGGRRILSRLELASDKRTLTLFYLEPLPGSARLRVTLNGNLLTGSRGVALDADGDGQPGGIATVDFETLSITPVMVTAVIGHVFASVKNPGGTEHPIPGVRISVIGAEQDLFTTTAADGSFRLEPCPSGRFFVSIDGRTSPEGQWPNGAYYPLIGKPWEAVAGRTNNLAAGTGLIYLPRVQAGTLQPVSAIQDTMIGFPASVIAENPLLNGVSVMVPANALYSDNGTRGGRMGLAPVASDRLPEPLPAGIHHALDISIQTDGPQNVDRPLPARFPNLPDPQTGLKLPPGAKSALMSYNHDTGRWEVQGPMTVTADGNYVETDPGVGVRQPGWHGNMGGTQGGGGPMTGPGTGPGPYNDDIDGDGKPNGSDEDVDGDGVDNKDDPDIDGDGIPNNQDSDMDGDGVPNNQDDDMDGDGVPNDQDDDPDGPDGQCTVSIDGADQGTCGGSLALGSSVSAQGGTYGWSIVGASADLVFPPPGQNSPGARLNLLSPGQVTVYLTYRPPGANSADTHCNAQKTITVSAGQPTIRIVSVVGARPSDQNPSRQTFITTDRITARAQVTGTCQPRVRWTVIGKTALTGTPTAPWEFSGQMVNAQESEVQFIPASLPGLSTFRTQQFTSGTTTINVAIEFDLKAEILDDSENPIAQSPLSNELEQDNKDRLRQEYVDNNYVAADVPDANQIVLKVFSNLFPSSKFEPGNNPTGGNYPVVADGGFTTLATDAHTAVFVGGAGRLIITSYYRNPRFQRRFTAWPSDHVDGNAIDVGVGSGGLRRIDIYRRILTVSNARQVILENSDSELLPPNWKAPDANNDLGNGIVWRDADGNGIPDELFVPPGTPKPPAGHPFSVNSEDYVVNAAQDNLVFKHNFQKYNGAILEDLFGDATHVHIGR